MLSNAFKLLPEASCERQLTGVVALPSPNSCSVVVGRVPPWEGEAPAEPGVIGLTGPGFHYCVVEFLFHRAARGAGSEEAEWAVVVFGDGLIFPQRRRDAERFAVSVVFLRLCVSAGFGFRYCSVEFRCQRGAGIG